MPEGQLERICREAGVGDLVGVLAEALTPTDLNSLLLDVFRRRAAGLRPADVLATYVANRFCRPAPADPRSLLAVEQLAWSLLPAGFDALTLSPVCPLGTSSAVASVSQHKVVTALRGTEVVSDVTNVLALEAALRRRRLRRSPATKAGLVRLAASQRLVRAQAMSAPGARPHFALFGLVSAGRGRLGFEFEQDRLGEHIDFVVSLVTAARPGRSVEVTVTDLGGRPEVVEAGVCTLLAERHPASDVRMDPTRTSGRGYYVGACYKVYVDGIEVADGGCTAWTRQMLSDDKERLVVTGLGLERLLA